MATEKKKVSRSAVHKKPASKKQTRRSQNKVGKVMHEFKEGKLHSRSKKGPIVKSRKQAIAIALSEAGASSKSKNRSGEGSSKKPTRT